MKKLLVILLLSIATVSCYDDYIFDYDYSGIYFPYQLDIRTFVVGEGMKVEVGANVGGVRENKINRNVTFSLKTSLITKDIAVMMLRSEAYIKNYFPADSILINLPATHYKLSNDAEIIIKAGEHVGTVVVRPDSAAFLSDPLSLNAKYVLPFYIETADADSIIEPRRYAIIGFRYDNMLFGNYWHGGSALINRPAKADTTITYYTTIPALDSKKWILKTASPNSLYTNGYLDQTTSKNEMLLTLAGSNITISTVPGSSYTILPDGQSTFNAAKLLQDRKIFLKYTYLNPGNGYTYHCTDTLTFRNRIRDGVNEWQDENPSHYN